MNVIGKVSIAILVILLMAAAGMKESGMELDEINGNFSRVEETIFNITAEDGPLPYTPSFNGSMNIETFVMNVAHGIYYSIVVEFMTLIGGTIAFSYKYFDTDMSVMMWMLRLITIYISIMVVAYSVKPVAAIYVLINDYSEEKGKDWNRWIIMIGSICLWLLFIGLIILGTVVIL